MDNINFKLPKMYEKFLEGIKGSEGFAIEDTGVILYEEEDLPERNLHMRFLNTSLIFS